MKHPHTVFIAFVALLLSFATNLAYAAPKPQVLPPTANAYGKSYDEWSAAWLQWAVSIPAATNPISDPTGAYAASGQSGKVWFLAGTFGGPAERTITVPTGTPLFFPIVNSFWINTPEYGDPDWSPDQENYARDLLAAQVDTATGLILEIDGSSLPNIYDYRFPSIAAECTIPADNIFGAPLVNNPYHCVADGYWVMIPPLSVGLHTIYFTGGFSSGFSLDVTYHITVQPGHKKSQHTAPSVIAHK